MTTNILIGYFKSLCLERLHRATSQCHTVKHQRLPVCQYNFYGSILTTKYFCQPIHHFVSASMHRTNDLRRWWHWWQKRWQTTTLSD